MAVRVAIPEVPPRFKIPVVPCTKLPLPDRAVEAVTVPELVKVPLIVSTVAAVNDPLFV